VPPQHGFVIAILLAKVHDGSNVERLRQMLDLGPTVVCLQLIGDADPLGSIRRYGAEVLPALRGARV
jgi:hypothetical protein